MRLVSPKLVENCKCEPVKDSEFINVRELSKEMFPFMKSNNGVGLAAPQIGYYKRFFIMRNKKAELMTVINPVITYKSTSIYLCKEGCLTYNSHGNKPKFTVKRHKSIRATYSDENGNPQSVRLLGFDSEVFQHEFDHLEGFTVKIKAQLTNKK